jgi:hypothetical protein
VILLLSNYSADRKLQWYVYMTPAFMGVHGIHYRFASDKCMLHRVNSFTQITEMSVK